MKKTNVVALRPDQLPIYDAACRALEQAVEVDDVKHILDVAERMRLYGKQADDPQIFANGRRLQERALRCLGDLIEEQRKTVGLAEGARAPGTTRGKKNPASPPTLTETGIDKNLAKAARKRAAMPKRQFDKMLADFDKPRPPPKPRRVLVHDVVDVTGDPTLEFQYDIEQAIRLADARRDDLPVTDEVLAQARNVVAAWTRCLKRLEGKHGK